MSLIKKVAPFIVMSGFLVAGNAIAQTQGTTVTFEALIRAASCDVSSTTEGSRIDWGTFTSADVASKNVGDKLGEDKTFNLELTNCSAPLAADGTINLYARGNKSNFDAEMFANPTARSLAVKLLATSKNVLVVPNVETSLKLGTEIVQGGNATIPMTAGLYLTTGKVDRDELKVPVTFTVAYN